MKIIDYEIYSKDRIQIELESFDNIDEIALEMEKLNDLNNIVPFTFSTLDDKKVITYNLKEYSRVEVRNLTDELMNTLIKSLLDCKTQILKNLMDFNNIFFSSSYIFSKDNEFSFIYIPVEEEQFNNDITKFVKSILLNGKFSKDSSREYILDLIELVNEGINDRNYYKILEKNSRKLVLLENDLTYFPEKIDVEIPTSEETEKKVDKIIKKLIDSFKKNKDEKNEAKSLFTVDGKEINIKNFIKIGSNINISDYYIKQNSIEDLHAIISINKGILYLEDNNSLTGTYVNKKKLLPKIQVKLFKNDEIAFGNKKTIFIAK